MSENKDFEFKDESVNSAKDDFETQDNFQEKSNVSAKNLDKKKLFTAIALGLGALLLVIGGVWAKIQNNNSKRAEAGIESAVSKPVLDPNAQNVDNDAFGFNNPQPVLPNANVDPASLGAATEMQKSPEMLEMERQIAEQQAQQAMLIEQQRQQAIAQEQALLNARYKSGIMVGSANKDQVSPNGDIDDLVAMGIPPELAPFIKSDLAVKNSQANAGGGQQVNPRIANNSAGSMGGRFDGSTTQQRAPIAQASYNSDRRLLIQQGKVLDAVLETAVKSDLPSNIIARITTDVYSEQGRNRLLPAGTRLFGQYSSIVNDGQAEIGAVWDRAITPNGVEIMLDSPSTNILGVVGLGGKVNNHYGRIFGTATLLSLIGAGVSNVGVDSKDENNASQTYRTEVAGSFGNQADRVLQRNLNIPPTITVKHGTRIKVLVAKDLDFSTIFNQ